METNRLHALRAIVEREPDFIDCTDTHLGDAGLTLPESLYEAAWTRWRAQPRYVPDPRGSADLRGAICEYYRRDGVLDHTPVNGDAIVATAGSSLSYELIFHLLAEERSTRPRVALPRPSYPLFEELSRIGGHEPLWYDLDPRRGYRLDRESVIRALEQRPTSIVLISPSNPTGTILPQDDVAWVTSEAAQRNVAIISDEVFSTFRPPGTSLPRPLDHAGETGAQIFTLNGLSKIAAAPEVKLGWIIVAGPDRWRNEHGERLAYLHDTYLSVSGFAEACAIEVLSQGTAAMAHLRDAIAVRRATVAGLLRGAEGIVLTEPEGGIHLTFSMDSARAKQRFGTTDDEEVALRLLKEERMFVHPGYLYGIDEANPRFVISCTGIRTPNGVTRLVNRLR